jgi:hypothetical protein
MTCQACQAPIPRGTLCQSCILKGIALYLSEEDPDSLKCENCGAKYSGSEARVQRRLKQVAAGKCGEVETPALCWVCTRLHYSAQTERHGWMPEGEVWRG